MTQLIDTANQTLACVGLRWSRLATTRDESRTASAIFCCSSRGPRIAHVSHPQTRRQPITRRSLIKAVGWRALGWIYCRLGLLSRLHPGPWPGIQGHGGWQRVRRAPAGWRGSSGRRRDHGPLWDGGTKGKARKRKNQLQAARPTRKSGYKTYHR